AGADRYAISFPSTGPITLDPGESTSLTVTFNPTQLGAAPATLSVPHSVALSPLTISLSGNGQSPPATSGTATVELDSVRTMSGSSTYSSGSFKITNNSTAGQSIQSVRIDVSTALLPDVAFDPHGTAGDPVGKDFTPNSGASQTGLQGRQFGGALHNGFQVL